MYFSWFCSRRTTDVDVDFEESNTSDKIQIQNKQWIWQHCLNFQFFVFKIKFELPHLLASKDMYN